MGKHKNGPTKKELFKANLSDLQLNELKSSEIPKPLISVVNVQPHAIGQGNQVKLNTRHPAYIVHSKSGKQNVSQKQPIFLPCFGSKSLIIGVGLELPSKNAYDILFNCINKLPEEFHDKWKAFQGKNLDFTIRSRILLYDKYGFLLKGGSLMKKKEYNVFEYEKRRTNADTIRLALNNDYRCSIQRIDLRTNLDYVARAKSQSLQLQKASLLLHRIPNGLANLIVNVTNAEQSEIGLSETLFLHSRHCEDIEQLRVKIVDPREVHHMCLVLHYDAPISLFLKNDCPYKSDIKKLTLLTKLLPKLKPYIRVIDADKGFEVLRYYIEDLSNLSVVLQLTRVIHKPEHEVRLQKRLKKYMKYTSDLESSMEESEQSVEEERLSPMSESTDYSSKAFFSFLLDNESSSSSNSDKEEILVKLDEDEFTKYTWKISPINQEWRYIPRVAMPKESFLDAFLQLADANTFGVPGLIPSLPLFWKITIYEGRSLPSGPLYCEIESNSILHTKKHRTNINRSHQWLETFRCAIIRGYRAGGLNITVFKKVPIWKPKLIGKGNYNFGNIKRPTDPDANPSITTWIPIMKGERQYGELKVSISLLYS